VVALDFDGTLVESNHIKDQAFETIFSDWPEYCDAMMKWHRAHNTIDRREKFRYFVEEFLNLPDRDDLIVELTNRFGMLTRQAIIDCPLVKGAQDFLEYIHGRVAAYLISATPLSDLKEIVKKRGLNSYFKDIYGAPINKLKIIKKIMMAENVSTDEILFIGDSPEDQQVAGSLGIPFVGRQSDRYLNEGKNQIFPEFKQIKKHTIDYYGLL